MQMHQVRYFLALDNEGSFVRAARRCGVSQPSLTRAIKLLEEELGGAVFERDRHGARLTELGILIRSDFAQIERSAAAATRKAAEFHITHSARKHQPGPMEALMRARHIAVVIGVVIIGLGIKQLLFPATRAEAGLHAVPGTIQMQIDHRNTDRLPTQEIHDMTFIYSNEDNPPMAQ